MLKSQKHVFWEALIITLFIFGLGILLGVFIENGRIQEVSELYSISELNLLDVQIQTELLNLGDFNCQKAIEENIHFGDKIFKDATILENYEGASSLGDSLINYHKRYDLLRTLFWINSLKIKEKCGENSFHTLVYLYDYLPEDKIENEKQKVFSNFLENLKEEKGSEVLLIPIAKNLKVNSLDLLLSNYNLNETSIILDEKYIFNDLSTLDSINDFL